MSVGSIALFPGGGVRSDGLLVDVWLIQAVDYGIVTLVTDGNAGVVCISDVEFATFCVFCTAIDTIAHPCLFHIRCKAVLCIMFFVIYSKKSSSPTFIGLPEKVGSAGLTEDTRSRFDIPDPGERGSRRASDCPTDVSSDIVFDEDRIDLNGIWHTTLLGTSGGMVG